MLFCLTSIILIYILYFQQYYAYFIHILFFSNNLQVSDHIIYSTSSCTPGEDMYPCTWDRSWHRINTCSWSIYCIKWWRNKSFIIKIDTDISCDKIQNPHDTFEILSGTRSFRVMFTDLWGICTLPLMLVVIMWKHLKTSVSVF